MHRPWRQSVTVPEKLTSSRPPEAQVALRTDAVLALVARRDDAPVFVNDPKTTLPPEYVRAKVPEPEAESVPAGNDNESDGSIARLGDQLTVPPERAVSVEPASTAHEAPAASEPVKPDIAPFLRTPGGVTVVQPSSGLAVTVTVVGPLLPTTESGGENVMCRLPTVHVVGPVRVWARSVFGWVDKMSGALGF